MTIEPRKFALAVVSVLLQTVLVSIPAGAGAKGAPDRLLVVDYGMLPIILSAPHGGREAIPGIAARRGIGVAQFTTGRDHNTAELAASIAAKLGEWFGAKPFLLIARFDRKYVDANRPHWGAYEAEEARIYYEAYHQVLTEHCERVRGLWGRGLLLDIHGQSAEAEAIFRGTDNLKSVTNLRRSYGREALSGAKSILGLLERRGYRVIPANGSGDHEVRYTGGYTTRKYGSHRGTGIDVMQLEFGSHLRARANLERTANDVASAIAAFASEYLPSKTVENGHGD